MAMNGIAKRVSGELAERANTSLARTAKNTTGSAVGSARKLRRKGRKDVGPGYGGYEHKPLMLENKTNVNAPARNRKNVNNTGKSEQINLGYEPTKEQSRAAEWANLKAAGGKAKENFGAAGGWKAMAGGAGFGAVAGGAAGAGIATVLGTDAWEGAKSGALRGAVGNGAVKGSRMAVGAWKGEKFGHAFGTFNKDTGMTKSVKSLHTLSEGTGIWNKMKGPAKAKAQA